MTGILVVSHSPLAAKGIAETASQMAGSPDLVAGVGGDESGGLGNSIPMVLEALTGMLAKWDEVVVIPDMGSSVLSAKAALEMIDGPARERVVIADAPVLEGAVVAAVEASAGSSASDVAGTANEAYQMKKIA